MGVDDLGFGVSQLIDRSNAERLEIRLRLTARTWIVQLTLKLSCRKCRKSAHSPFLSEALERLITISAEEAVVRLNEG